MSFREWASTAVGQAAAVGSLPSDTPDERLRKSALVLSSLLITILSFVWVGTYAALGLWRSALIPLAYQVASLVGLAFFAKTKRYNAYRASQVAMFLILPFLLQWSLGGFVESGAVAIWAFVAPLGALVFYGPRKAIAWFGAFLALVAFSAAIDGVLPEPSDEIPSSVVVAFFALNIVGPSVTTFALLEHFVRSRDRAHELLAAEQERSETLLLSIFPQPIAERLKISQDIIAERSEEVSVVFADITGFTPVAERLPAEEVVVLLDEIFSAFDELVARHGLEKIKTIGDGYLVAAGIPTPRADHAEAAARLALAMRQALDRATSCVRPEPPRRHRLRAGRRRRHRPDQVRLRPLGGHRQHGEQDAVSRPARRDPGDRANVWSARGRLPPRAAHGGRRQGQGRDDDVRSARGAAGALDRRDALRAGQLPLRKSGRRIPERRFRSCLRCLR